MFVTCLPLVDPSFDLSRVREFVQILRFDSIRISLALGDQRIDTDVPSTEWLEEYIRLLRSQPPVAVGATLHASGYWFQGRRDEERVSLTVYDDISRSRREVELSLEQAHELHRVFYRAIEPFIEQGGRVEELNDIDRFVPVEH